MRKIAIVVVAATMLAICGCRSGTPATLAKPAGITVAGTTTDLTSLFSVDFQGIIVHSCIRQNDVCVPNMRRAVLVAGDLGRTHTPFLAVVLPEMGTGQLELRMKLRDVTGKIPHCNADQCFIMIDNFAMRIRGDYNTPPKQETKFLHPSFDCLVPKLSEAPVYGGFILPEISKPSPSGSLAHLPSAPAVGFFEIENGMLSATKFERTGFFKDADYRACIAAGTPAAECAKHAKSCREFAHTVTWEGVTEGRARLQIASNLTSWKWEDIPTANGGPLMLYVENLANRGHMSVKHFSMNAKLLTNKKLPEIGLDCTLTNSPCSNGVGFGAILAVPGCSDNQWP